MWKVYTKRGDTGLTDTATGTRMPKNCPLIDLQGGIDEINSNIGYLRSLITNDNLKSIDSDLKTIQKTLFYIGSEVSFRFSKTSILDSDLLALENQIDILLKSSPEINSFVYCSGTQESTYSQVIRTIIRRVERSFISALKEENISITPISYRYINRLSDYFFSLARFFNASSNIEDEPMIF
ncbi:MAG: cob(I)yrinic acid a,c-diamide adenosyltransferase [Clostridium sp.]